MVRRLGPGSANETDPDGCRAVRICITSDRDIVEARQAGRRVASDQGFGPIDQALISTAISELARNALQYAGGGTATISVTLNHDGRRGICIVAADDGPGIPDVNRAVLDGVSTSGQLGLGLPGVRRLMDEFEISSTVGRGTVVTARKWRTR